MISANSKVSSAIAGVSVKLNASSENDCQFIVEMVKNCMNEARKSPMQPPTIPHAIDGYQVDKNSNRCMLCHARANAEKFQAPPVSVTHYMDRDDQFLATISPRRVAST